MKLTTATLVGATFIEGGFSTPNITYKKVVHIDTGTGEAVVSFIGTNGQLQYGTHKSESLLDNLNRGLWKVVPDQYYRRNSEVSHSYKPRHIKRHF